MTDEDPTRAYEAQPAPQSAQSTPVPPPQPGTSGLTGPVVGYGAIPPVPAPPAPTVVAPAPVEPARRGRGSSSPLRWIAALLVVALVVVAGVGATVLLTGSTGTSAVVVYAPADTVSYAEARLDLPGSQRAEVAKTLSALPGFADQSTLDAKLSEVLDRLIKGATGGKHDYQTEIAPWFGGQVAVALGPSDGVTVFSRSSAALPSPTISPTAGLPACTGVATAAPSSSTSGTNSDSVGGVALDKRELVLANVTDAAKADAWASSIVAERGDKTSDATCDGVTVHLVQASSGAGPSGIPTGWAVLGGRVLVVGDLDSIRLAIATKGTSGLNTDATFQKATAALPGDHLGFAYENLQSVYQSRLDALTALGKTSTDAAAVGLLRGLIPDWVASSVTATGGNFVVQSAQPASDVLAGTNTASALPALAPTNTIALLDVHDLGKTLTALHDKIAAEPTLQPYLKQLDDTLGLAGGFSGALGWIGDAGLAVTSDGSAVSGGVIIAPTDQAAAAKLFTQLRALLALAGGGSRVTASDEAYKGATITTIDLSALAPLLEKSLGSGASAPSLPKDLKLVYTVTDKAVVLTRDPAFAKAVIDVSQGGASLATDPRFSALLSQAGAQNNGLAWLDITAVRGLAEAKMSAAEKAKYEADIKPYLLPIDALLSVGVVDSGLQRSTTILSVKH